MPLFCSPRDLIFGRCWRVTEKRREIRVLFNENQKEKFSNKERNIRKKGLEKKNTIESLETQLVLRKERLKKSRTLQGNISFCPWFFPLQKERENKTTQQSICETKTMNRPFLLLFICLWILLFFCSLAFCCLTHLSASSQKIMASSEPVFVSSVLTRVLWGLSNLPLLWASTYTSTTQTRRLTQ